MKAYRQDIFYVLDKYAADLGDEKAHYLADKICELYACSKTLINMPDKLISLFNEVEYYDISKKLARKIAFEITCQSQLSELFEELHSCDILTGKLFIDREEYVITLKVHDDFIVKSHINTCKTYINGKFYYDIEEQDLLECYCGFVTDNCIYVLY